MGIEDKINEIRRKPEHIRLRWVWALSIIFTFFVVVIWIISFKVQNKETAKPELSEDQKKLINEFSQQKKSLKDATGEIKDVFNNQIQSKQ